MIDAPCPHVSVSLIYAAPGARWACDECGEAFHPVAWPCLIPPPPAVCHPYDEACGGSGGPCRNHGGTMTDAEERTA
jgi:hypothetical protein